METDRTPSVERVLIIDESEAERARILGILEEALPDAAIQVVGSVPEYRSTSGQEPFDVVLVDHNLSDVSWTEFLHELKLRDFEPSVLVVSDRSDSGSVAELFNTGCERYIRKEGRWLDELGPAVRHAIRLRRLEEQNRKLVSKLTEANILLEEKNRRLDEFSAAVAHDLRGPLGGIVMKLDYILECSQGKLEPKFEELLKRALKSTERLTGILQGMYTYAKLGAQSGQMGEVNLAELVDSVVADLHFDDALNITIGIGDLPTVWGNSQLLSRLFINLINNAVKYNDKDQIVIHINCDQMQEAGLGKFCRISVSDNGRGISEGDRPRIFSLFFRGGDADRSGEGIGLGLSFVQRIVELHFGRIEVESQPGQGTTFRFTLPMEEINFVR